MGQKGRFFLGIQQTTDPLALPMDLSRTPRNPPRSCRECGGGGPHERQDVCRDSCMNGMFSRTAFGKRANQGRNVPWIRHAGREAGQPRQKCALDPARRPGSGPTKAEICLGSGTPAGKRANQGRNVPWIRHAGREAGQPRQKCALDPARRPGSGPTKAEMCLGSGTPAGKRANQGRNVPWIRHAGNQPARKRKETEKSMSAPGGSRGSGVFCFAAYQKQAWRSGGLPLPTIY